MSLPGGPGRTLERATGLAAALLLAACAKEEAPPGALPDTQPPQVARTEPKDRSVVPDWHGDAKIVFDEPIQPPADLSRQLVASPAYRYGMSEGFSDIKIDPDGGWRPGVVYVLQIPPGIPDLLGNRMSDSVELVFSTGPPLTDTRVSGHLLDRITGRPATNARVLFEREGDTIPYSAVADTGGGFKLGALPPGSYRAYGFRDLNGDLRLQPRLEPYDSATFDLADSTATATMTLRLTDPDSTPPRLARVTIRDSVTVALEFDDYLDPAQDFDSVQVTVRDTATGTTWPVERVGITLPATSPPAGGPGPAAGPAGAAPDTTGHDTIALDTAVRDTTHRATTERDTSRAAVAGGVDTVPPGTVTPDTTHADTVPLDTLRPAGGVPRTRPSAAADTTPLPSQTALVRLGRALQAGTYRVTASDFRNVRNLVGGGDTTFVFPPPDSTRSAGPGSGS